MSDWEVGAFTPVRLLRVITPTPVLSVTSRRQTERQLHGLWLPLFELTQPF